MIEDFGGLAHKMPVYSATFLIIVLSSVGLPGLNGFVGEFLILQGTFLESHMYAAFAALAIIFAAVYLLWMYQRVFMGKISNEENHRLLDLNSREILTIVPLIIVAIWMGVSSSTFLRKMDVSIQKVVDRIEDVRRDQVYLVENHQPGE